VIRGRAPLIIIVAHTSRRTSTNTDRIKRTRLGYEDRNQPIDILNMIVPFQHNETQKPT
jgi:hypothetical protein